MNEYLAPGVYVEEVAKAPPTIELADSSVAALVGTATDGPLDEPVEVTTAGPRDGSWLSEAVADFLASGGERVLAVRASTPEAGLAALADRPVRLLVVEHDLPSAYSWAAARHAFLVVDADPGPVVPQGLGADAAAYFPPLKGPRPCAPAVAGAIARNDRRRAVWKSPSGSGMTVPFEPAELLSRTAVDDLVGRGVNPLRILDRKTVVWGARTAANQDPEWRYVPVRRTVLLIEDSLEQGLQWAAFEPNTEDLWTRVRSSAEDLLFRLWREGALQGRSPDEGFFVRCDRTTMTQDDIDDGRLVCEIGVALVRPAEFVVFRIGQRTAGSAEIS